MRGSHSQCIEPVIKAQRAAVTCDARELVE
jgi:hypothetical protein